MCNADKVPSDSFYLEIHLKIIVTPGLVIRTQRRSSYKTRRTTAGALPAVGEVERSGGRPTKPQEGVKEIYSFILSPAIAEQDTNSRMGEDSIYRYIHISNNDSIKRLRLNIKHLAVLSIERQQFLVRS